MKSSGTPAIIKIVTQLETVSPAHKAALNSIVDEVAQLKGAATTAELEPLAHRMVAVMEAHKQGHSHLYN